MQVWGGVSVDGNHGVIDNASDVYDIGPGFKQQGVSWVVGAVHLGGLVDFVPQVLGVHKRVGHGDDHVVQIVGVWGRYVGKVVFGHEICYVEG